MFKYFQIFRCEKITIQSLLFLRDMLFLICFGYIIRVLFKELCKMVAILRKIKTQHPIFLYAWLIIVRNCLRQYSRTLLAFDCNCTALRFASS